MSEIPILGQGQGRNGADNPAPQTFSSARSYVAEVTTISGAKHRLVFEFSLPADPNGVARLEALKDFDPERQTIANITNTISQAHSDPLAMRAHNLRQGVTVTTENGACVVWRYIESFRYLGPVDDEPLPPHPSTEL